MSSVSKGQAIAEPSGRGTRLDGWKEIAAYLNRAERTVKRWGVHRGLPTHRIPGDGRRAVFAWSAELDEWLRSSDLENTPGSAESGKDSVGFGALADEETENTDAPTLLALQPVEAAEPEASGRTEGFRGWRALVVVAVLTLVAATLGLRTWWRHAPHAFASPNSEAVRPTAGTIGPASASEQAVARDLYLKGRYEWNQRTPDSLNLAVDSFTQAIVHDPHNAEAYVGLAETYALLREYSTMPDTEAFSRSLAAAKRAVELDDSLAEAHRALAFAEMYGAWNFTEAEREFRRAIRLNPKDPLARLWYANAFGVPGHYDESLRQINIAQTLDPGSHAILADKGWMLFFAGQRDEGIRTLREVERIEPGFYSPHSYLMQIGLELRDYPMFLDEGEKMAAAKQDDAMRRLLATARVGYERHGSSGLLKVMYDAGRTMPASYASSTMAARICILMGKDDEALTILEEEYGRHDASVLACLSEPLFLGLRSEPRYQTLIREINFPTSASGRSAGL